MKKYKKETIASYDKNAEILSRRFKRLMDLNKRREFKDFIKLLNGKDILDLGCGSGDHALYFSKKGLNVIGIDLSKKMIDLCEQKGLNARVMDIEDLKFEDNSFDGIWATTSLLHIPKFKIKKVVDKLCHILRERGVLYVCVKEGEGEKFIDDKEGKRYFAFWKKEELLKVFKERFELIEFRKSLLGDTVFLQFFLRKK